MFRIISFIGIIAAAVVVPWWLFLALAALYALRFPLAFELLLVAFLLDATYGRTLPWLPVQIVYTLATLLLLATMESIRPYLAWYDRE